MPVVDASVVVDWVAPDADDRGPAARLLSRLAHGGESLAAPRLLSEEVGNALLTGVRRGRWTGAEADGAFTLLRRLPIDVVDTPADVDRAWELARRFDEHPLYDMVYIAVAQRLGEELLTADAALARRLERLGLVRLVS